jgi:hypothetical protein
MVPPLAALLNMMGSIHIVDQIIVSRRNNLLTNPPQVIGVNRLFNLHIHVPMPPARPRQSTR